MRERTEANERVMACPFCGADGDHASYVEECKPAGSFHWYECNRCKARGPYWMADGVDSDGQMNALAHWNLRPDDASSTDSAVPK